MGGKPAPYRHRPTPHLDGPATGIAGISPPLVGPATGRRSTKPSICGTLPGIERSHRHSRNLSLLPQPESLPLWGFSTWSQLPDLVFARVQTLRTGLAGISPCYHSDHSRNLSPFGGSATGRRSIKPSTCGPLPGIERSHGHSRNLSPFGGPATGRRSTKPRTCGPLPGIERGHGHSRNLSPFGGTQHILGRANRGPYTVCTYSYRAIL